MLFRSGNKSDAAIVIRWLKEECEQNPQQSGFYHNRDIIELAAKAKRMICQIIEKDIVGFCVFNRLNSYWAIDIFEIRPDFRSKGLGQQLAKHMLEALIAETSMPIKLECSPAASEKFWRNIGFEDNTECRKSRFGNPQLIYVPPKDSANNSPSMHASHL